MHLAGSAASALKGEVISRMRCAAILDVDGTLVDTNYHHVVAWYRAFRQSGVTVPLWRIHRSVGMGGDHLIGSLIGAEAEAEIGDEVRTAHTVLYMALIGEVAPISGAKALVAELRRRGHPVVLSSSASSEEVGHYIDQLDVREDVQGWTTSADVEATKPEPDLIKAALDKAGTDNAVLIGDTPYDIEAARKVDVPTIALMTGGFSEQELLYAGAVIVFESIEALCANLDATPLTSG